MTIPRRPPGTWFKSSRSPDKADCVEVCLDEEIGVRDTKDRPGGQLGVGQVQWRALLDQIKQ